MDQGAVKIPLAACPEEGKLVSGEAVHRGAQGRNEGHILPGVVHDLEEGQSHVDLGGLEKVLPAPGRPGDALLAEGPEVVGQHRTGAAQKDHHVGRAQGPQGASLLHHQGGIQQRPDAPGGKAGLQQVLVRLLPFLAPQKGQVQDIQLQGIGTGRPTVLRKFFSRHQGLVIRVVQLAKFS